jgi:eukaryotic-like serine/threonine-protein kinase
MRPSTLRSTNDQTVEPMPADRHAGQVRQFIRSEWSDGGNQNLVGCLRRHPELLHDKSLLLNLALEEFQASPRTQDFDLEAYCAQFGEFGSSIQRSIFRQLEVACFLGDHPELLEALNSSNWPQAGDTFGHFFVLEEMGAGATAKVYLCLETDVGNRKVVVKATPYASFEASILGRLNHPAIMPIYSTGVVEDRGLYYLCMPYCGRSTLADVLHEAFQGACPRGDLALSIAARQWTTADGPAVAKQDTFAFFQRRSYVDRILHVAIQVADALEHAHNQKIVHGDLKPSNVLITPDGQPLLLDFNLSQDATTAALRGGTLPYMPPEHLEEVAYPSSVRRTAVVNTTSEIYSFGALLYELLGGDLPAAVRFDAHDSSTGARLILARLREGIAPLRQRNSLVSRRLESIVHLCLSYDPTDRPAKISHVKRLLRAELRSISAVGRMARVRPVFFSSFVVLPVLLMVSAIVGLSLQPARFVIHYENGLQLIAEGDYEEAVNSLSASVEANPSFSPAEFHLGRALVGLRELDAAINHFSALVERNNDCRSMVYLGYCFNLKRLPNVAILWYERARRNGDESLATFNNLGASYVVAQTHEPRHESLKHAEEALTKALEMDPTSMSVQLNLVRFSVEKASIDSVYDPVQAWQHAYALIQSCPDDPLVQEQITSWYDRVMTYKTVRRHESRKTYTVNIDESARDVFEALYRSAASRAFTAGGESAVAKQLTVAGLLPSNARYILEPSWPQP